MPGPSTVPCLPVSVVALPEWSSCQGCGLSLCLLWGEDPAPGSSLRLFRAVGGTWRKLGDVATTQ